MSVARFCQTPELPVNSLLLLFVGNDLLTDPQAEPLHEVRQLVASAPVLADLEPTRWRFVAHRGGQPVYAARNQHWQHWPESFAGQFQRYGFRALLPQLDQSDFELIASASQLLTWEQDHNFCCRCGSRTRIHPQENAMCCDSCGYRQYPRINPCIITLITRGDQVLLARNASFKPDYFSCVAGFIEPGESAELALRREVFEEVGVQVKNIRYHSSQSWPFPHSLMLGFICEYDSGDINVDGVEIVEARWGTLDDFPQKPGPFAISGQLMQSFAESLSRPDA